jgi:hypothetical protein
VKTLKECTFVVDCDATSTVLEVKHRVAEQDAQWEVQRQRCPATSLFLGLKMPSCKMKMSHGTAQTARAGAAVCASGQQSVALLHQLMPCGAERARSGAVFALPFSR